MSKETCTIRPARAEDADAVAGLWSEMGEEHRTYDKEVWCWSRDARMRWKEGFIAWVGEEDMITLVAENPAGQLIGYGVAHVKDSPDIFATARTGEVWDLCVMGEQRKCGVGAKLMEAVFEQLKGRGAEDVVLHVALANPPAVRLYKKLGMRPVMYRMYKRL